MKTADQIDISINSVGPNTRKAGFELERNARNPKRYDALTSFAAELTGMIASLVQESCGQYPPSGVQSPAIKIRVLLPKAFAPRGLIRQRKPLDRS